MSNSMGTQSASVCRTGYEIHSCLKIGATKISCVLDKGYNSTIISPQAAKEALECEIGDVDEKLKKNLNALSELY